MSGSTSSNNVIGYGSDSITLNMAEDQALGTDAIFTVNVDGQQIGGEQTVYASQAAGQTEGFTFLGDFGAGQHNVTVSFVNNFIYPGLSGDRNLYVDSLSYDGQTVTNGTTPLYVTALFPPNSTQGNFYGNATFQVNDTTPVPAGTIPQATTTPGAVSIGSGPDTLVLNMAEDAYQGDAQFTVSVDGQQIGGVQTTTALVDDGQAQEFDVHGDFGSGSHNVTVNYLNDAVGGFYPDGTPGLPPTGQWALDTVDRNLYVMGASLDGGTPSSGAPWELSSSGPYSFSVTSGGNQSASASAGLFASDGAAATSDNPPIPSGSLGTQSSMTFIASASASDTSSNSGASSSTNATGTSSSDTSSTGTSANGASAGDNSALSTTVASATPTVQDVAGSTTPASASGTDMSSTQSGSAPHWMAYHHGGHFGGYAAHGG